MYANLRVTCEGREPVFATRVITTGRFVAAIVDWEHDREANGHLRAGGVEPGRVLYGTHEHPVIEANF